MDFLQRIYDHLNSDPGRPALEMSHDKCGYTELKESVEGYQALLARSDVKPGEIE